MNKKDELAKKRALLDAFKQRKLERETEKVTFILIKLTKFYSQVFKN